MRHKALYSKKSESCWLGQRDQLFPHIITLVEVDSVRSLSPKTTYLLINGTLDTNASLRKGHHYMLV